MGERRPLIGITCGSLATGGRPAYGLNQTYVRAIEAAGGIPLLIPPQASIEELFGILDGIVFPGGGDVDPARYGSPNQGSEGIDGERDELEIGLARMALATGLPALGICRGQQVINVAQGGGLLQDVGDHRQAGRRDVATHEVLVEPDSRLAEVIGERISVNTLHHQVVDPDRVGRGLRVTALSADGQRLIEGLESEDGRMLAVQWHPEELTAEEWARDLFQRFVGQARARD